jgi:hypothetical protein
VLEQQRVLAEFGELALKTEALDDILNKGCELVGRALDTALAKVMELLPDGKTFKARRLWLGAWRHRARDCHRG